MAKLWMGLNEYKPVDLKKIENEIIITETNLIDKKLVQSSLTLLQNYEDLLPLRRLDTLRIARIFCASVLFNLNIFKFSSW